MPLFSRSARSRPILVSTYTVSPVSGSIRALTSPFFTSSSVTCWTRVRRRSAALGIPQPRPANQASVKCPAGKESGVWESSLGVKG